MHQPAAPFHSNIRLHPGTLRAIVLGTVLGFVASGASAQKSPSPADTGWQKLGAQLRPAILPPASKPAEPPATPITARSPAGQRPKAKAEWPPPPPSVRTAGIGRPVLAWSAEELSVARTECRRLLKDVKAVAVPEPPLREGAGGSCGDPAPMRVMSIGKTQQVVLSPAPLMSCRMVAAMYKWLERDLQPLARRHLKSQIVQIDIMSNYSCRTAYGRRGARLSEHGRANALDFNVIRLADRSTVTVLSHWGPTKRDILAAKAAAEAARAKAKTGGKTRPAALGTEPTLPTAPVAPGAPNIPVGLTPQSHLGGPKEPQAPSGPQSGQSKKTRARTDPRRMAVRPLAAPDSARNRFLRAAHERGCRVFGTILGPEANEAHRNHFHVDMAERTRQNFCE